MVFRRNKAPSKYFISNPEVIHLDHFEKQILFYPTSSHPLVVRELLELLSDRGGYEGDVLVTEVHPQVVVLVQQDLLHLTLGRFKSESVSF